MIGNIVDCHLRTKCSTERKAGMSTFHSGTMQSLRYVKFGMYSENLVVRQKGIEYGAVDSEGGSY